MGGKFGTSSLMRDGKVFAMFMKGRFVAKLPAEQVDRLVRAGDGEQLVMGKRRMAEWLAMDGSQRRWLGLARDAYRFVGQGTGRATTVTAGPGRARRSPAR